MMFYISFFNNYSRYYYQILQEFLPRFINLIIFYFLKLVKRLCYPIFLIIKLDYIISQYLVHHLNWLEDFMELLFHVY